MYKTIFREILKVLIVMYTAIVVLGASFIVVTILKDLEKIESIQIIVLSLVIVAGILSVLFHVNTYTYYSTITRKRKLPKILWIAAIFLPSCVMYKMVKVIFTYFYGISNAISQDVTGFVMLLLFLFFSVVSIVEVMLMPKRIKKQHDLLHLTNEFDDIGN